MSRSQFRYVSVKKESAEVVSLILKIKEKRPTIGVKKLTAMIRREVTEKVNHKRVERIVKTLGLGVKRKPRRKKVIFPQVDKAVVAIRPNQVWAMDFVSDRLQDGRTFRCLTIVDIYSRQCPKIEVSLSMKDFLPVKVLEELKRTTPLPEIIIADNGSEFKNYAMLACSKRNGFTISFIDPGRPTQNGYIESFNARLREECLNQNSFRSITAARAVIEEWVRDYNEKRPHGSLDYLTPKEFAELEQLKVNQQTTEHQKICRY